MSEELWPKLVLRCSFLKLEHRASHLPCPRSSRGQRKLLAEELLALKWRKTTEGNGGLYAKCICPAKIGQSQISSDKLPSALSFLEEIHHEVGRSAGKRKRRGSPNPG